MLLLSVKTKQNTELIQRGEREGEADGRCSDSPTNSMEPQQGLVVVLGRAPTRVFPTQGKRNPRPCHATTCHPTLYSGFVEHQEQIQGTEKQSKQPRPSTIRSRRRGKKLSPLVVTPMVHSEAGGWRRAGERHDSIRTPKIGTVQSNILFVRSCHLQLCFVPVWMDVLQ